MFELGKENVVQKDDMIPDLLMLPPGTDLHNHPLVTNGSVFMQGKASSMIAVALGPKPGWEVIDACAAPGNKTVHLAALMKGEGKLVACELNKDRVKRLEHTKFQRRPWINTKDIFLRSTVKKVAKMPNLTMTCGHELLVSRIQEK